MHGEKIKISLLFLFIFLLLTPFSFANKFSPAEKKSSKKITGELGLNIPQWGIAIDGIYDPQLDHLIPGYKILNVVLTNRSGKIIYLNPKKDKWELEDSIGKEHTAINHLGLEQNKLWLRLPEYVKEKFTYPQAVRQGHSAKIDLFFKADVELADFRKLFWKSDYFKEKFHMIATVERNLEMKHQDEPIPATPSREQSDVKYHDDSSKKEKPAKAPSPFDPTLDDFSITMD